MKTYLIILSILLLMISACNLSPGTCVNDNYCSDSELLVGSCDDCLPDFSVDHIDLKQGDGFVEASYCIKNNNGQYDGDLDIYTNFGGTNKAYERGNPTKQVNFVSDRGTLISGYKIENGKISFDTHANYGDQEEYYCGYEKADVLPSSQYCFHVMVNPNNEVKELDVSNNDDFKCIETGIVESYPEFLIENNLGDYEYDSSELYDSGDVIYYNAHYYNKLHNHYTLASVADYENKVPFDKLNLEENGYKVLDLGPSVDLGSAINPKPIELNIYYREDGKFYDIVWFSQNYVISTMITGVNNPEKDIINNDLVKPYLVKYQPGAVYIEPEKVLLEGTLVKDGKSYDLLFDNSGSDGNLLTISYDDREQTFTLSNNLEGVWDTNGIEVPVTIDLSDYVITFRFSDKPITVTLNPWEPDKKLNNLTIDRIWVEKDPLNAETYVLYANVLYNGETSLIKDGTKVYFGYNNVENYQNELIGYNSQNQSYIDKNYYGVGISCGDHDLRIVANRNGLHDIAKLTVNNPCS